jgi:hypothetical protein
LVATMLALSEAVEILHGLVESMGEVQFVPKSRHFSSYLLQEGHTVRVGRVRVKIVISSEPGLN